MIKEFTEVQYRLRLITPPYQGTEHVVVTPGGERLSTRCCRDFKVYDSQCPLCDYGCEIKRFWLVGTIDRADNTYKVYKFNYSLFTSLKKYVNHPNWGEPKHYDIDLIQSGAMRAVPNYVINGLPHRPLSAADEEVAKNIDTEYLLKNVKPYPKECVTNFMRRYKLYL